MNVIVEYTIFIFHALMIVNVTKEVKCKMNQLSRWIDCKYCPKKCNGSFQYMEHKQNFHKDEWTKEVNSRVVVWCVDCKTIIHTPSYHLKHNAIVENWGLLKHIQDINGEKVE